jgi:hypothetical protein
MNTLSKSTDHQHLGPIAVWYEPQKQSPFLMKKELVILYFFMIGYFQYV